MTKKSDAPAIRFKGFSDAWEQRKLSEMCGTFEYGLNAAAKEFDGKNKYIRITDIDDASREFLLSDLSSPDICLDGMSKYLLSSGDIVFARTGASVGKTYIYRENDGIVYFAGFLIRAKVNQDNDAEFVFQSTLSPSYEKYIRITSQRSGQPGVNAQEYKELSAASPDDPGSQDIDIPYDLVGYLTEIDTGVIDADYMNSRFDKYLKLIRQEGSSEESIEQAKAELHKTFAALTQEEQKYANIFLHDIERGDVIAEDGKTLRDYITEYQFRAKDDQIHRFATIFGLDEDKLRNMMGLNLNEATINEFGRFDELKKSVDKSKAKAFFEAYEQTKLIPPKVNMKTDQLLRQFILTGGFEVDMP